MKLSNTLKQVTSGWNFFMVAAFLLAFVSSSAQAGQKRVNPRLDPETGEKQEYEPPTSSKEVLPYLNAGLPPVLKPLYKRFKPDSNYITWIIEAPPKPLDLRSAEQFRRSIVGSGIDNEGISHMMVAYQCHDANGKRYAGGVGMTGESEKQAETMIDDGYGLAAFYAVFTDGDLNSPEDIQGLFEEAPKKGYKIGHMTFEVKQQQCENMMSFLKKFIDHPNKPATKFATFLKPLKFEGGGCGTFATALLTHAGIMPKLHPYFWRSLKGSSRFVGNVNKLPEHTVLKLPPEYMNRYKYVWKGTMQMEPWQSDDSPAIDLLDPEMALVAFRTIGISLLGEKALENSAMDERTVKSAWWGAAGRGYYEDFIKIDGAFDYYVPQIQQRAKGELKALRDQGYKSQAVKVNGHLGFLFTL